MSMPSQSNPLTYPRSQDDFDSELFKNPSAEYRGAPFWSWNGRLERERLLRQIDQLEEMGMGGFHIHCRVGLDTEYMGTEFMDHVKACIKKAKTKNMLACLYDEDRWPSGAAGGLVVKGHPEYQAQHLLLTPWKYGSKPDFVQVQGGANGKGSRSELGFLVARYDVCPSSDSQQSARRLLENESSGSHTWYAYVEPNAPSEWYNGQTYVDTLNTKAIQRFVELTHDVYHAAHSDDFGTVIPSIFTDEPQFAHKSRLRYSAELCDIILPWTSDLPETFKANYGSDLLDNLPHVVWDLGHLRSNPESQLLKTRYHFHDHVCERFVTAFMDQISGWCRARNIAMIGHMMKEPTLLSQTQALGEAMRCYRRLDMPGVDILCDSAEYNTVKQASSVARQNGAKGIMSEVYGVTNWTFDFAGHKASGDWQAVMGVTFRVHHLNWYTMAGEAKRDYPAAIGYQSPWYREYPYIENHFARVNVAMTRGKPITRIAVIHPIESYWLCYGPMDIDGDEQEFREEAFADLTSWLSFGLIDFDFISESLLPDQCAIESIKLDQPLNVGKCQYEAILVPNLKTIRSTTMQRLRAFSECGGRVILAGSKPSIRDAKTSIETKETAGFQEVLWSKYHILENISHLRDISIKNTDEGSMTDKLLYQLREDEADRFLFVCNTDRKRWYNTEIRIRGDWSVTVRDTLSGNDWDADFAIFNDWTTLEWHFEACESLLLHLRPRREKCERTVKSVLQRHDLKTITQVELIKAELSEPNVVILDYPSYKVDDGPWQPEEEILRIENKVRDGLGLPRKGEAYRQPWSIPAEDRRTEAHVCLRYEFSLETTITDMELALEFAGDMEILLDDALITSSIVGWWVDEDISRIQLPSVIAPGTHVIELRVPFTILTNLDRVYILGTFAVEVRGRVSRIKSLDMSRFTFGDWTLQGFPFYAGNVTYHCNFKHELSEDSVFLRVPFFAGPVLTVDMDCHRIGTIALQPNTIDLGILDSGEHNLQITCYGNRENAFGALHMPDGVSRWFAPNAWRSEHDWWVEGYNTKAMGIIDRPVIKVPGKEEWVFPRNPERLWTAMDNTAVV